jgi:hypothetical protein
LIDDLGGSFKRVDGHPFGTCVWKDVEPQHVLNFISRYRPHPKAGKVQTEPVRRYIESRVRAGELVRWTVALISIADGEKTATIGGVDVKLVHRKADSDEALKDGRYVLRRMISPTDESIDFLSDAKQAALELTRQRWDPKRTRSGRMPEVASGLVLRELRPKESGLLLIYPLDPAPAHVTGGPVITDPIIGYAISFPGDSRAGAIEYVVNNVYYQQELGFE